MNTTRRKHRPNGSSGRLSLWGRGSARWRQRGLVPVVAIALALLGLVAWQQGQVRPALSPLDRLEIPEEFRRGTVLLGLASADTIAILEENRETEASEIVWASSDPAELAEWRTNLLDAGAMPAVEGAAPAVALCFLRGQHVLARYPLLSIASLEAVDPWEADPYRLSLGGSLEAIEHWDPIEVWSGVRLTLPSQLFLWQKLRSLGVARKLVHETLLDWTLVEPNQAEIALRDVATVEHFWQQPEAPQWLARGLAYAVAREAEDRRQAVLDVEALAVNDQKVREILFFPDPHVRCRCVTARDRKAAPQLTVSRLPEEAPPFAYDQVLRPAFNLALVRAQLQVAVAAAALK